MSESMARPVIDFLTYCSYAAQRIKFPDVDYKRWASIFGADKVEEFEREYARKMGAKNSR